MVLKRDISGEPLTWAPLKTNAGGWTAIVTCHRGHQQIIEAHTIAGLGNVEPEVRCPEPGCNFSAEIVLEGWGPFLVGALSSGE